MFMTLNTLNLLSIVNGEIHSLYVVQCTYYIVMCPYTYYNPIIEHLPI